MTFVTKLSRMMYIFLPASGLFQDCLNTKSTFSKTHGIKIEIQGNRHSILLVNLRFIFP